jgi:hypothetical protein
MKSVRPFWWLSFVIREVEKTVPFFSQSKLIWVLEAATSYSKIASAVGLRYNILDCGCSKWDPLPNIMSV